MRPNKQPIHVKQTFRKSIPPLFGKTIFFTRADLVAIVTNREASNPFGENSIRLSVLFKVKICEKYLKTLLKMENCF